MDRATLHRGDLLNPRPAGTLELHRDGGVLVDGAGRIAAVGGFSALRSAHPRARVADHSGRLILPGFVDCHVHLAQVFARARFCGGLLPWLQEAIFPEELRFSDLGHAERATEAFVGECVRAGVTTAAVYLSSQPPAADRCLQGLAGSGLRVVAGLTHMDHGAPEALCLEPAKALAATEALAARWHGHDEGRLQYALAPRFALSCTAEHLRALGALYRSADDLYVHTHLSENHDEVAEVRAAFPEAPDYTGVYEATGLLGPRTILAHAIHLSPRELAVIAACGAGVAHCPSANLFLKSGVFSWESHAAAGVRFGLGSDVGAGPEMSPLRVLRDAASVQPRLFLSPQQLLWRATLGGAQALRLDAITGSLDAGKEADLVVLDPSARPEIPAEACAALGSLCAALIFLGDDRLVESTWVRGRRLA